MRVVTKPFQPMPHHDNSTKISAASMLHCLPLVQRSGQSTPCDPWFEEPTTDLSIHRDVNQRPDGSANATPPAWEYTRSSKQKQHVDYWADEPNHNGNTPVASTPTGKKGSPTPGGVKPTGAGEEAKSANRFKKTTVPGAAIVKVASSSTPWYKSVKHWLGFGLLASGLAAVGYTIMHQQPESRPNSKATENKPQRNR